MKTFWSYISAILAGVIIGIVIAIKWLSKGAIEINVDKIKNKRTSGTTSTIIPISVKDVPTESKKELRKKRRAERKLKRKGSD